MAIVLRLPMPTPSQNSLMRMKWITSYKAKLAKLLHKQMHLAGVWGAPRERRFVRLTIRRYSSGRLDRGNFIGGCKPLLDTLKTEGLIRDDSESWLDDHYEQHPAPRGEAYTEIIIEHRQGEEVPPPAAHPPEPMKRKPLQLELSTPLPELEF